MIGKLTGTLTSIVNNQMIIDIQGVGYIVFSANASVKYINNIGSEISVFIETIVKEDSITLYGFSNVNDKECFCNLLSVQGVGAKLALIILSFFNYSELNTLIITENKEAIKSIPGIGNKVAERLVRELKDKINTSKTNLLDNMNNDTNKHHHTEALNALIKLGYSNHEALNAIRQSENLNQSNSVEYLIKSALATLGK